MKQKIKLILRKLRIMPENPVDEATLAQCVHWPFADLQVIAAALGIGEDEQKRAYIDLFRGVSAEKWAEAQRRIRYIRSKMTSYDSSAIMLELARGVVPPPAKTVADLEREARAWYAARYDHQGESFLSTVWEYISEIEPHQGPARQWLELGLKGIAAGVATHLSPRPVDPPATSMDDFERGLEAQRAARVATLQAMEDAKAAACRKPQVVG